MRFKGIVDNIIGRPYRHALFYAFPGGLRFGLSEGGSPLEQVLLALRKATVVCEDVFGAQDTMLVHLAAYASVSGFEMRKTLRALQAAGIAIPKPREVWHEAQDPDEEDGGRRWVACAFEAPASKLQSLLWCACAADIGASVQPNPRCRVYLLKPDEGIVVHPYDDRGMDVVGHAAPALAGLYQRHRDLLLAYDMEAMDSSFAKRQR